MTIHQLYDGGPANSVLARTQWPAYAFSASDPAFASVDTGVHNGSPVAQLRKSLDFKNDYALRKYFRDNAVAQADVLNILLLPPKSLLLGLYVEVENPQGTPTQYVTGPTQNVPTTSAAGGTLAAGTYFYKVTALTAAGESTAVGETSVTTTGTTSSNTVTWTQVTGATGYRIYRGTAAGAENTYFAVGAVGTFTDTGAAGTAGSPPAQNTAALPNTLTMTFGSAAGLAFGSAVAVDCTVASANFAPPGAAWLNGTAGGTASLATAKYLGTQPDMVQATLTAMGNASLAGFGNLRLEVEATIIDLGEHFATNF